MNDSTPGIIFMIHCESNTGYAIGNLEHAFFDAALLAGYRSEKVFFSYPSLAKGKPRWMSCDFMNYVEYDFLRSPTSESREKFSSFLLENSIKTAFVFDLQPHNQVCKLLRRAGVETILAYWGAPMSSLNRGLKLWAKRAEIALRRSAPDGYIFESEAMLEMAVMGRGIPLRRCVVIPTGVDTDRFCPLKDISTDVRGSLQIPQDRKLFIYTGHMEERKGVHIIVQAMDCLVGELGRTDIHFLALGNRPGEARRFYEMLAHPATSEYITFGGYRADIERVFQEANVGVVASTGWDSWPMSVIEMASSGLPLLVSDFQGLKEFVVNGENGYRFSVGDHRALAALMARLADDPEVAAFMGRSSRQKVIAFFSRDRQLSRLADVLRAPGFAR